MSASDNLHSINGLIHEAAEDVDGLLANSTLVFPPDFLDAIRKCKDTVIDYLEHNEAGVAFHHLVYTCLLYTSPSPRD